MADKKLNEVTKVTDLSKVKTFLAVMEDNTIQQMSKEDMAAVVGGLIGTATIEKNGLLPYRMASFTTDFSTSDIVLNFSTIYNLQSFLITCYLNGTFSTYLVNPSMYQSTNFFEVRYLGRQDIEIYAKAGDNRIFIKPSSTSNGSLSIQLLNNKSGAFKGLDKGTVPEDFTKINMVKM